MEIVAAICLLPLGCAGYVIFIMFPLELLSKAGDRRLAKIDREKRARKKRKKK